MHRLTRLSRSGLLVALAAAIAAPVLAGCGSSSHSGASVGESRTAFLKFATCMRANRVPAFPDPSAGGGGIHIGPGAAINPLSPAFRSAFIACEKQLPGGGPKTTALTESQKLRALKFAQCMRAHGVPNFPDPGSGAGPGQAIPDITSPAARRAIKTCHGGINARL